MDADEVLTEAEVLHRLGGISSKTLVRMIAEEAFPPGFPAGRGIGQRWYEFDVRAYLWMRMRIQARPSPRKKSGKKPPPAPGETAAGG